MAIRSHKSKMTYNTLAKLKGAKGQTMIYNTLHREIHYTESQRLNNTNRIIISL